MRSKIRKNIICAFHFKCQIVILFLHLFITDIAWSIIRNCCCLNNNILFFGPSCHFFKHFSRRCDWNNIYKMWLLNSGRSCDKCNIRSTLHTYLCNRIPHLSGRMIRNIAYRINGLLCRTCCNQNMQSFHILFSCDFPQNIFKQKLRFRHFPCSCISTGKITNRRADHFIIIMLQYLQVILNDWILKHIRIHCRSNDLLTFARHDRCCQHVIRNAMSNLPNHIRTCRCQHNYVRFLR